MVTNYFTLRALVDEWQSMLGYRIGDAYSQQRGELTIGLYGDAGDEEWSLKIGTTAPMPYLFRYPGHNRPRRNVTPLFEEWWDHAITAVELAHRDRFLRFTFADGSMMEFMPFGPRANVFVLDADRIILRAFRHDDEFIGRAAPEPVPAPAAPGDAAALQSRLEDHRGGLAKRLSRAIPLLDRQMAAEVCFRAEIDPSAEPSYSNAERLLPRLAGLIEELAQPAPVIYLEEGRPRHFSLVPMLHLRDEFAEERHSTVDEALRRFVRGTLGRRAFDRERSPLLAAVEREAEALSTSLERMLEELARPSRADAYERFGHLLMAHAAQLRDGAEEVRVPDLFSDDEEVLIRMNPDQTIVQNAERYYARARRTRQAREHAERRLESMLERQAQLEAVREALRAATTVREVRAIREGNEDLLRPLMQSRSQSEESRPYRRFIEQDVEILVGRSARHNDRLTFEVARKFDLWLHARGVSGSHVIIRRNRNAELPPTVIRRAASLAAWFSKARGSALVPVIITERKFVRSAKGAPPGAVIVEREEVIMAEPRPPDVESS